MATQLDPFVRDLPKVELHIHVEGTLEPETRWKFAQRNNIPLQYNSVEDLKKSYVPWNDYKTESQLGSRGLAEFLKLFFGGIEVLRTQQDFYELATGYFYKAAEQNIRHAEVFFDLQAHTRRDIPVATVMDGLQRAKEDAEKKFGITSAWIMCIVRDMSVESAEEAYEQIRPYIGKVVTGIGLDSNEHKRPPKLFDDIFTKARRDGLKVSAHCDPYQENTHEHILQCASTLCNNTGLDRIDHGFNVVDKQELIDLVRERGIGLTLAPHCYRRRWPQDEIFNAFRKLYNAGIKITLNSDDPVYMQDFWLADNYQIMKERPANFTDRELLQVANNAIDISWASEDRKRELAEELHAYASRCSIAA